MEQENSKTSENTASPSSENPADESGIPIDVNSTQQHSFPDGADPSSGRAVGGSKVDKVSAGPNVEGTIAGRN